MSCAFKDSDILRLSKEKIDEEVETDRKGVYGLDKNLRGPFVVYYVGRSDTCLNDRLKKHLDEDYIWFRFVYAKTAEEAYNMECECYHFYGGKEKLDNDVHPDKPEGTDLKCPVCGHDC